VVSRLRLSPHRSRRTPRRLHRRERRTPHPQDPTADRSSRRLHHLQFVNAERPRLINAAEVDDILIALRDALAALTPTERAEFRAELSATLPPALRSEIEQLDAARTDATNLITLAETIISGGEPPTWAGEAPGWIRLGAIDTALGWVRGTGRTCMHAPDPHKPEPVWAAAWKPNLVVCTMCVPLLKVFGDTDKTCDCCGRVTVGVEAKDGIFTLSTIIGAMIYQAGACRDCLPSPAGGQ
jgi:hypothetical protein